MYIELRCHGVIKRDIFEAYIEKHHRDATNIKFRKDCEAIEFNSYDFDEDLFVDVLINETDFADNNDTEVTDEYIDYLVDDDIDYITLINEL